VPGSSAYVVFHQTAILVFDPGKLKRLLVLVIFFISPDGQILIAYLFREPRVSEAREAGCRRDSAGITGSARCCFPNTRKKAIVELRPASF
jgi:hypothetical protein